MSQITIRQMNLDLYDPIDAVGDYDFPRIDPEKGVPESMVPFNHVLSGGKADAVHFFIDDYQFQRVWSNFMRYVPMLGKFRYVLSPDFSLYRDMPLAMQIWNAYRGRLIGRSMQRLGMRVIPSVSWSGRESFSFAFQGLPEGATLAIATMGAGATDDTREAFMEGFREMVLRLSPETVICYGSAMRKEVEGAARCRVVWFENEVITRERGK